MPELGPLIVAAHNRAQAEYLIRSRAQQRGVAIRGIDATEAGPDTWAVTVDVDDSDAEKLAAAALDEETQVFHLRSHPRRPRTDG